MPRRRIPSLRGSPGFMALFYHETEAGRNIGPLQGTKRDMPASDMQKYAVRLSL